ncbi:MAG: response regulator [Planctomycetota bacterium]
MSLSTRILLRICLPALALLLAVGVIFHQVLAARQIEQTQRRLEHAARCAVDHFSGAVELLGVRLQNALAGEPGTAEFAAGAQEFLRAQPIVRAIEIHSADGTGLLSFGHPPQAQGLLTANAPAVPSESAVAAPPEAAEEGWRQAALRDGQALSWQRGRSGPLEEGLVRLTQKLTGHAGDARSQNAHSLLASAIIDERALAVPAMVSGGADLGSVTFTIESADGTVPVRLGPALTDEEALSASALLPLHSGRLVASQSRAYAIAGLVSVEFGASFAVLLLITALVVQLRGGLGRDVLRPVHQLTEVVTAFESGRPTPPRTRDTPQKGELATLDVGLRRAVEAVAESQRTLRDLNASLEERVTKRTSEILAVNQELRTARDEARLTAKSRMAFVAYMSHELRTPLNAIVGMSGLLLDTRLDAEQRDNAETIRNASQTLLGVINTVLDLTRAEAGHLPIEAVDFDLATLVDEVGDLLASTAHRAELELVLDVDPACPARVRSDPNLLRQVLVNLTANAIKFTERGEVVLRARLEDPGDGGAPDTGHAVVRFEVLDTGIGLTPEAQARLFQPYVQAEDSTSRRYGGTGLGLAISKQIVLRLGGRIGVESQPGTGSTFWCSLPLAAATNDTCPVAGPIEASPPARWELQGLRTLFACSGETARRVRERRLRSLGLRVSAAASGAEALDAARRAFEQGTPFGLVLIDDALAGPSAAELAHTLGADPALQSARRVLLTRHTASGRREAALAAGFHGTLAKPFRQRALVETLAQIVSAEPTRSAAALPAAAPQPSAPKETAGAESASTASDGATSGVAASSPDLRPRLLVAEDSLVNQKVMRLVLEKLGYRVDVVDEGQKAVAAAAATNYDAVLMDCQLPDIDGCEATVRIRAQEIAEGRRRVPILAMTAAGLTGDRERVLRAGMDDYLTKPILREQLATHLEAWIARAPAGGTPVSAPEPH